MKFAIRQSQKLNSQIAIRQQIAQLGQQECNRYSMSHELTDFLSVDKFGVDSFLIIISIPDSDSASEGGGFL